LLDITVLDLILYEEFFGTVNQLFNYF